MPTSSPSDHARRAVPAGRCPACGRGMPPPFVEFEHLPVNTTRLYPTAAQARAEPLAAIRLGLCDGCGLIRNVDFDPALVAYDDRYENTLDFSSVFRAYQRDLARRLVSTYGIRGKDVVELGPGSGEFLRVLCEEGDNRGVGFDPARREPGQLGERVRLLPGRYDESQRNVPVDMVCFRHVLEHVDNPRQFLDEIRRAIGDRASVLLYVEVPDAGYMIERLGIWDVIYQHCSYFTEGSLQRTLRRSGFRVRGVGTGFGGQYLFAEGGAADVDETAASDHEESEHMRSLCDRFGRESRDRVDIWDGRLQEMFDRGSTPAMWGAGAKGVTFLNLVPAAHHISTVVDVNPRKQGSFVPGTGQPIVPPERLLRSSPDVVLTTNPMYRDEIDARLADLGLHASVEMVNER